MVNKICSLFQLLFEKDRIHVLVSELSKLRLDD